MDIKYIPKEICERKRVELLEAKEELQYLLNLKN